LANSLKKLRLIWAQAADPLVVEGSRFGRWRAAGDAGSAVLRLQP
jgi:hypothetical protein